jgi:lipid-A-disaccharide synthase-like uncharacterized protein
MEEVIGFTGMVLILFAFIMNQTHKWKDDSLGYDLVNAVGSVLLIVYAMFLNSYPFLILNGIWALVSLRDLVLDVNRIRKKKAHVGHRRK